MHSRFRGRWLAITLLVAARPPCTTCHAREASAVERLDALRAEHRWAETESVARHLLSSEEAAGRSNGASAAAALDALAAALLFQGRGAEDEALRAAQRAIAARSTDAEDVVGLCESTHLLAQIQLQRGELEEAVRNIERAVELCSASSSVPPTDLADLHELAGVAWLQVDRLEEGERHFRTSLELRRRHLGPDDPSVASSLAQLRETASRRGALNEALELAEEALRIREAAFAEPNVLIAASLNDVALQHDALGDSNRALELLERSCEMQLGLGPSLEAATCLDNLGAVALEVGDVGKARPALERALELRRSNLPPGHPDIALSLQHAGQLMLTIGDHATAELYLRESLEIFEQRFGPSHSSVEAVLSWLGVVLQRTERPAEAMAVQERRLAIAEELHGPIHPSVALAANSVGILQYGAGEYATAERTYRRALKIREAVFPPTHPGIGIGLMNLAEAVSSQGRAQEAADLSRRAVSLLEQGVTDRDPRLLSARRDLAGHLLLAGDIEAALQQAVRAESAGRELFRLVARSLPEREVTLHSGARSKSIHVLLAIAEAARNPAIRRAAWDQALRSRGLALDELAARRQAVSDPSVATLREEVDRARRHEAELVNGDPDDREARLLDARSATTRSERTLVEASRPFRLELERASVGLDEVEFAMLPGDALVACYFRNVPKLGPDTAPEWSYVALVLRAGDPSPDFVRLGEASEIEQSVERWRAALLDRSKNGAIVERRLGRALAQRIWDPVAGHVGGARRVFFVPARALHLVNFAALPDTDGRYLVESGPTFHVLAAERDVAVTEGPREAVGGLLVVGDPDFDARPWDRPSGGLMERASAAIAALFRGDAPSCAAFGALEFSALPGARREAGDVARAWRRHSGETGLPSRVVQLLGDEATEETVKTLAIGCRVLHVATHGFLLPPDCTHSGEAERSVLPESPLARAGLALAGFNRRTEAPSAAADGVLTAEEIASLDLSRVDSVVLSACETGLGEIQSGEGVLGLQRAFAIAGARSLVMSLWPVSDEATRGWMQEFYAARLGRHLGAAESVRAASRAVLDRRRADGLSASPFYWGAFVGTGTWD